MPRRSTSKKRPRMAPQFVSALRIAAIGAAGVVLAVVLWTVLRSERPVAVPGPDQGSFDAELEAIAQGHGIGGGRLSADQPIRKEDDLFVRTWTLRLPDENAFNGVITDLSSASERYGVLMEEGQIEGLDTRRLWIGFEHEAFDIHLQVDPPATPTPLPPPTVTPRPEPAPGARGRLAILLDDAGQSMDLVDRCSKLPSQVGVAILPFLPSSTETAAAVHETGHEVWLHLPMEPVGYPEDRPGPGAVIVSMDESEVRRTVHTALNTIPHVVGVNNHMGSRATADLRTMTWVMQELKGRGMAFIDSRTTTETMAEVAARSQGVPTGRRHVFLDNDRSERAIELQLAEVVYRARLDGDIIAIGHMNATTIAVLERELPRLASRGADLVNPTELLD